MATTRSTVCAVFLLAAAANCAAAEDATKTEKPDIARVTCRVHVVDALGNPVQGAIVVPTGFRTLAHPKGYCEWITKRFGRQPQVKTDADGIAEVQVPKFAMENLEIGTVTWLVDDPDHVVDEQDHNIKIDPAEIRLKDGYRIAATAVDAQNHAPIKEHLFAVQSGLPGSSSPRMAAVQKRNVVISRVRCRTSHSAAGGAAAGYAGEV